MNSLGKELKAVRTYYEQKLHTMKKVKHHLTVLQNNSEERMSGEIALRVAESGVDSAKEQLEAVLGKIRLQTIMQKRNTKTNPKATDSINDRDHFSEALAKIDPKHRLQLAK